MRKNSKVIYLKDARRDKKPKAGRIFIAAVVVLAIGIGVFIGLLPNAYQISINGNSIGALRKREYIEKAMETVKVQLENQYDTKVELKQTYEITKVRAQNKDLITTSYLTSVMRKELEFLLEVYTLKVDGKAIAVVASKEVITDLKSALTSFYFGEEASAIEFVNKVELEPVFAREDEIASLEDIVDEVTKTTKKEIEYEVVAGDTLSGIANKLGITMTRLLKANEGMTESSVIQIGMTLKAEVDVPLLQVQKMGGGQ